jgi:hypothetical protein
VKRLLVSPWLALALVFVGLFGATVAVSGLWAPLPPPKAGGTCGPGLGSEAAVAALVDPGSIGAGAAPPATKKAARAEWSQFVSEATEHRALITIPVLIVSLVLAVWGLMVLWRRFGRPVDPAPPPADHPWWIQPSDPTGGTARV